MPDKQMVYVLSCDGIPCGVYHRLMDATHQVAPFIQWEEQRHLRRWTWQNPNTKTQWIIYGEELQ